MLCISEQSYVLPALHTRIHTHLGHLGKPFVSSSESKVSRLVVTVVAINILNFVNVYMYMCIYAVSLDRSVLVSSVVFAVSPGVYSALTRIYSERDQTA